MIKNLLAVVVISAAVLLGAYLWFQRIPKPDLSNRGEPVICDSVPSFANYPVPVSTAVAHPWVNWDSNLLSKEFMEELSPATMSAINFAGEYVMAEKSCGTNCQMHVAMKRDTGVIGFVGLQSATGIQYRPDSRLVVVNPTPVVGQHAVYYQYDNGLQYICEVK